MDDILDLLGARTGLVCAVGAGGKKTTLYWLAMQHPGRVGLTSTVLTAHFPRQLGAHVVIADEGQIASLVIEAATSRRLVAFAHPSKKKARHAGLSESSLDEIRRAAVFDVLLVKADGARTRWIKAPADQEPAIHSAASTVIPVVSAKAIGARLTDESAHRSERLASLTGARPGEPITPEHVASLLSDQRGALKGIGDAEVVPVINMVDDEERESLAVEVAELALGRTDRFDRVVLTSTARPDRLVRVIGKRDL